MDTIDAVSRAYLIAGLALGSRIDGFVDSYYGPADLQAEADSLQPEGALDALEAEINQLAQSQRQSYLTTQLQAMRMAHRIAAGEQVSYREQVSESFDIEPEWTEETAFESAAYALDQLLPGSGAIAERRQAYRARFEIVNERIAPISDGILSDLRARTQARFPLPEGEQFELALVSDKPWSGYNWYLGNLTSRIEINTDLPVRVNDLPNLLAHEAYPGHHTEHSIRETLLREHGYGEFAIALLTTPQAVISEGIATNALDMVVPADEQAVWLNEHAFRPAGLDVDIEGDLAIARAGRTLGEVTGNAALLVHEQGQSVEQAVEYQMRYGLRSEREARQSMEFIVHPLFRTYVYTYSVGYDLVQGYLRSRPDQVKAFAALLSEHWTPTRLRGTDRRRSSDDERLPF